MITPNALSSLRVRLATWLLLPLCTVVLVCGYLSWQHAAEVSDYVQDRDLLASAKVLADRLIWEDDNVRASVPPSALSLFMSPEHDQVFLRVVDQDGHLLAGAPDFPPPSKQALTGNDHAQWYDMTVRGQRMRAVMTRRPMYDNGQNHDIEIYVGKTTHSRDSMLLSLWLPTVIYLLIAVAFAVVLTVLALTRELRPLTRLNRQLAECASPHSEEFAIDTRSLHSELRPVVDTVNDFARRLRAFSRAQQRFIADAAHQLRTPLALQSSQLEFARLARESGDADDLDAVWRALKQSNRQLIDVTNKLLLLAQAENSRDATTLSAVPLAECALRAVEHMAALADLRHIDLGMSLPPSGQPALVKAEPALLDALISNLVDNALRYTPTGGRVTVGISCSDTQVELRVDDNGPGIPAEARERVFERFYRLSSDSAGTGLGLAIVREIALTLGAEVSLESNPDELSGLRVQISFPAISTL